VGRLRPPPARVLDAGCGTGRVGVRLAELGYDVVGVDADPAMVEVAREQAPERPGLAWHVGDLAHLPDLPALDGPFDVVLLAGNVVPLLEPGTLEPTCAGLAARLAPDGLLVGGFGLDEAHLPDGCPVTTYDAFLAAAAAAGLGEVSRHGTWDGGPWSAADGYVVVVMRLVG
jgi:SAM-dependent methyltransferase